MNDFAVLVNKVEDLLVSVTYDKIFPFAGVAAVCLLIYAGIKYITGGPKGSEDAKKTIIAVVIGLLIIIFAAFIVNQVTKLLQ
ncbi:MAG: TrbC/VirB2 family protein [Patescibacteria group bacterium]|nr:TrbC/VirB2 family protein [Patescibacteria group bacterium]